MPKIKEKKRPTFQQWYFPPHRHGKSFRGEGGLLGVWLFALLSYIDSTPKSPMGRTLIKLRIGCHNLGVVAGRYVKTPLDERICPLGSGNKMEEDTHL